MKYITSILLVTLLFASCQKELPVTTQDKDGALIYLSAVVEEQVSSRAAYPYTAPNSSQADGKLYTVILASTTKNMYQHIDGNNGTDNTDVSIHTEANFDNNTPQLLKDAVYPKLGTPVYFIGLYPQKKWTISNDGTQANITIDGSQDAMFAPRIEGTYAQDNQTLNSQKIAFKHLLTWFKINIKAEDETSIKAWGKIKSLKITSKKQITVDLSAENSNIQCVSYSNDDLLSAHYISNDNEFPGDDGYELKLDFENVAYVLCSPVDATAVTVVDGKDLETAEYTLYIETEKRKIEVPIDLRKNNEANGYFTENTRSRYFSLNLLFKMGNTIVITATLDVTDWYYGGMANDNVRIE